MFDPAGLDFLDQVESQTAKRGARYDSLCRNFDPLARLSMLPQKNSAPASPAVGVDEVADKETRATGESPVTNMGTPRKNPALAAIDRLLFYSPSAPSSTDPELAEAKQKKVNFLWFCI